MNSEFFAALDELEQKRGIPKAYMLEKIEAALVAAYKKEYGNNTNVRVSIDENKKDVRVFQQKTIVAEVEDPETEISLEEAKKMIQINPEMSPYEVGCKVGHTNLSTFRKTFTQFAGCTLEGWIEQCKK